MVPKLLRDHWWHPSSSCVPIGFASLKELGNTYSIHKGFFLVPQGLVGHRGRSTNTDVGSIDGVHSAWVLRTSGVHTLGQIGPLFLRGHAINMGCKYSP